MTLTISEKSNTIHCGGTILTLKEYIAAAKCRHDVFEEDFLKRNGLPYGIPFDDEDLPNAICDWYSMVGEFSEEELTYLEEVWDLDQWDVEFLLGLDEKD